MSTIAKVSRFIMMEGNNSNKSTGRNDVKTVEAQDQMTPTCMTAMI
jgi:hypothetical protein